MAEPQTGHIEPRPYRALGRRIKALRDRAGLSQRQLGEQVGVSETYFAGVEVGRRRPEVAILRDTARVLDVSYEELGRLAGYVGPVESSEELAREWDDWERAFADMLSEGRRLARRLASAARGLPAPAPVPAAPEPDRNRREHRRPGLTEGEQSHEGEVVQEQRPERDRDDDGPVDGEQRGA